jgi:hypothetical protein
MNASRHLHSALHPLTCLSAGFPWRTFTLAVPLQPAFGYYAASVLRSTRWHFRAPLLGRVASEFPSSNR